MEALIRLYNLTNSIDLICNLYCEGYINVNSRTERDIIMNDLPNAFKPQHGDWFVIHYIRIDENEKNFEVVGKVVSSQVIRTEKLLKIKNNLHK